MLNELVYDETQSISKYIKKNHHKMLLWSWVDYMDLIRTTAPQQYGRCLAKWFVHKNNWAEEPERALFDAVTPKGSTEIKASAFKNGLKILNMRQLKMNAEWFEIFGVDFHKSPYLVSHYTLSWEQMFYEIASQGYQRTHRNLPHYSVTIKKPEDFARWNELYLVEEETE